MCSLCGAFGKGPAWEHEGLDGETVRWQLHREARRSAALVSELMRSRRVRVSADPHHGFRLASPTGGVETARSLAELWHAMERRRIPVPDPLEGV